MLEPKEWLRLSPMEIAKKRMKVINDMTDEELQKYSVEKWNDFMIEYNKKIERVTPDVIEYFRGQLSENEKETFDNREKEMQEFIVYWHNLSDKEKDFINKIDIVKDFGKNRGLEKSIGHLPKMHEMRNMILTASTYHPKIKE